MENEIQFDPVSQALVQELVVETRFLDSLPGMIYRCGTNAGEMVVQYISSGSESLLGHPPEKLRSKQVSYADMILEEDAQVMHEALELALKFKEPYSARYRIRTATGKIKWVREIGHCMITTEDELIGIEGFVQDESDAESMFRDQEEIYKSVFKTTGTAYVVMDLAGRILDANDQLLQKIGASKITDVRRDHLHQWINPDDGKALRNAMKICRKGGTSSNLSLSLQNAVGETAAISMTLTNMKNGECDRILGVCQPVHHENKVVSRNYYLELLNNFPAMIWRSDEEGEYTFFNQGWLDFRGRSVDDEMGAAWMESVHPDDFELLKETQERAFENQRPFEISYRLKNWENVFRWVHDKGIPVSDDSGVFIGFQGYCIDITEQKTADEALKEGHQREETLAEISPVGIFRTDHFGMCCYANRRWCEIADIPQSDAHGRNWTRTVHPNDRKAFIKEWSRFARNHDTFTLEYRIQRGDGSITWVLCQARPEREESGHVTGCVGTITDLTERHRLEEEQLKLSKLESVGILAGGIAHDFNNQLTPVLLNLATARTCSANLPPEVMDYLEQAQEAALQAKGLTHQLLTFAKGGQPIRRIASIADIIRDATKFSMHGSSIKAELEIAEQLWAAEVDPSQLSQVIQNLVINASQASKSGSLIRIIADNVFEIDHPQIPKKLGKFIRIDVVDEGTGIPEKNLSQIFDPYFSTKPRGHGLGLASAISIIQKHQGNIAVESVVDKGTTFSIFLKASSKPAPARLDKNRTIKPGKGRILVMDDEILIQRATKIMLSSLGYDVVTTSHGHEAIEAYRKGILEECRFDVALMDLTIQGGMGGKDAVEALIEIDPSVKAVVFSGYSNDPIMAHFTDYGFCAAIQKPFQPHELADLLSELTEKHEGVILSS